MAKVGARSSDVIYAGATLTIRAMRRRNGSLPAKEWADNLNNQGRGQLLAAARIIENTLLRGRPPAGRAEQVVGSAVGLWELKITKPGSTAPHLRLLYVRKGQTLWAATGFTKQKNRLTKQDISLAEGIAAEWVTKGST